MTASEIFPRTLNLPHQSPKYWVKEKDRYLRQLLIGDIQEQTQRDLIVYYTNSIHGEIDFRDADDISEIIGGCTSKDIDLLIQTPGGNVDACEKLISVLRQRTDSYRVVVPSWAKSAGTIIAISSTEILMGVNSELGPIDPQFNGIPAQFVKDDKAQSYPIRKIAENAIERTKQLAKKVLSEGMFHGKNDEQINTLVNQLGSSQSYLSHGAVINAHEASDLGLSIKYLEPSDALWQRLWLLYCLYDYDCQIRGYAKIFEGISYSMAKPIPSEAKK